MSTKPSPTIFPFGNCWRKLALYHRRAAVHCERLAVLCEAGRSYHRAFDAYLASDYRCADYHRVLLAGWYDHT